MRATMEHDRGHSQDASHHVHAFRSPGQHNPSHGAKVPFMAALGPGPSQFGCESQCGRAGLRRRRAAVVERASSSVGADDHARRGGHGMRRPLAKRDELPSASLPARAASRALGWRAHNPCPAWTWVVRPPIHSRPHDRDRRTTLASAAASASIGLAHFGQVCSPRVWISRCSRCALLHLRSLRHAAPPTARLRRHESAAERW